MKYCDQGIIIFNEEKGTDLDPNNVKWSVEFKTSSSKDDEKKNVKFNVIFEIEN
jgi:hypothetical protein